MEAPARESFPIGVEVSSVHTAARMQAALESQSPVNALYALAQALKAEGMSQREMYQLFNLYRAKHQDDADETKYDAVADTMDFICGNCSPHARLFDSDLA
jgi:hypothetical protein